jgi:hypothetical protein
MVMVKALALSWQPGARSREELLAAAVCSMPGKSQLPFGVVTGSLVSGHDQRWSWRFLTVKIV